LKGGQEMKKKSTPEFNPFHNESDAISWQDLRLENRLDRISLMGSLDITRDKEGLLLASDLAQHLSLIVSYLQQQELPDHIKAVEPSFVKNPFQTE
jgi:hypothetical protein